MLKLKSLLFDGLPIIEQEVLLMDDFPSALDEVLETVIVEREIFHGVMKDIPGLPFISG